MIAQVNDRWDFLFILAGHFCTTYFEPWVEMMDSHWRVHELESTTDYRMKLAEGVGQ